jgi:hypothetical protein
VCAAVTVAFTIAECGYFIPYGGNSPGPRFLAPALPFLALGLGPALARWRIATTVLAGVSILATTAVMLTWADGTNYRQTIWGEIARVVTQGGSSRLAHEITKNLLAWGPNRIVGAVLVSAVAATAFLVAIRRPAGGPLRRLAR